MIMFAKQIAFQRYMGVLYIRYIFIICILWYIMMISIIEVKVSWNFLHSNLKMPCALGQHCNSSRFFLPQKITRESSAKLASENSPKVCEIDSELKLLSHSTTLATMLLRQSGASLEGRKFTDFIAPGGGIGWEAQTSKMHDFERLILS